METLTTRRLDLAPYDPARDLDALHAMFADPEWARGGYSTPSRNEQESIDRVERESATTAAGPGYCISAPTTPPSA